MNIDEKRRILQTALTKGPKAARLEVDPILLFYAENGRYFDARGSEISSRFVEAHPQAQMIAKADLDL